MCVSEDFSGKKPLNDSYLSLVYDSLNFDKIDFKVETNGPVFQIICRNCK